MHSMRKQVIAPICVTTVQTASRPRKRTKHLSYRGDARITPDADSIASCFSVSKEYSAELPLDLAGPGKGPAAASGMLMLRCASGWASLRCSALKAHSCWPTKRALLLRVPVSLELSQAAPAGL